MRNIILSSVIFGIAIALSPSASSAPPPTDAEVQQVVAEQRAAWQAARARDDTTAQDLLAINAAALDKLDLGSLTPKQVGELLRAKILHVWDVHEEILGHMTALKDDETTTGATARVHRLFFIGGVSPQRRPEAALQEELLADMLAHPALTPAIRSGEAGGVINAMRFMANRRAWYRHREAIFTLADDILACDDYRIAFDFPSFFEVLTGILESEVTLAERGRVQNIRAGLVTYMREVLARSDAGDIEIAPIYTEFLGESITLLDASDARGTLIGAPAPPVDFTWSSDDSLTTLAALKDHVVVLDFWATWCGPCVATFPNVRELQRRYERYPVTIIGVTSLQGAHHGPEGTVDCKGDPAKEITLMAEYIRQKNISWTIAFAKQPVYNPAYGVNGIPHVTIVAPDGTVRFNGLHPTAPLAEKAAMIDALLAEFGLPTPVPLNPK